MRTFKIISFLAFIALAATANADCHDECLTECHLFATDLARDLGCLDNDDGEVMEFNQCEGHCKHFCDIFGSGKGGKGA